MNTIYYKNRIEQFLVPKQSFGLEMLSNAYDKKYKIKLMKPSSQPAGFMTCMQKTRKTLDSKTKDLFDETDI